MYLVLPYKNLKAQNMASVLLDFSSKELNNIKDLKFVGKLTWWFTRAVTCLQF